MKQNEVLQALVLRLTDRADRLEEQMTNIEDAMERLANHITPIVLWYSMQVRDETKS